MLSINTNVGAMIALQSLGAVNRELAEVTRRISTGLKISSPKDNGAIWAIAQGQRSEMKSLDAVTGSLKRGQSIVDVAISGGETISDLLTQMKEKMLAASDVSLTASDRALLSADYVALRKQIDLAASNASFNGVSLISSGSSGNVRALANANATDSINVDHIDLSTTGSLLGGTLADLTTVTAADLTNLDNALKGVNGAVARLGTGARALETHETFISKLQDTLEASIGRLVDADLAKESARFAALQVKQQLAIQALSIANQQPNLILQLFRN
ncbi:MAG: flagellin [Caulobacteraceae bacterium]|nr:MAG: flagellin [Caulobacteraceae bacterium]